ncbi:hypothetical protein JCM21142_104409 [Saccharicrinis fermentans DSM 9555 = JCM 21142]|uniref:Uncharacterized protein n=1 Tax=Saccharicrinis fermentans DSM 9555 = JCM 21142 TaxID=869213 RepID=W7YTA9_9BACT|nr:hypothetical protein JCM21142_104409 [Saccharicrinis fermentans DSM 9555 = JCM 21142]
MVIMTYLRQQTLPKLQSNYFKFTVQNTKQLTFKRKTLIHKIRCENGIQFENI